MSWFVAPDTGAHYEVFSGGGGEILAAELGVPLLAQVPLEPGVARAGDAGLPIVAADPGSPAAKALAQAAEGIVTVVRGRSPAHS
jgi:ATP-binding protein involved in chromosome partitioning